MQRVNPNQLLSVAAVHIKGRNEPLCNCFVFITDHFLVVGMDKDDTAPDWYNIDEVERLVGVERIQQQQRRDVYW